MNVLNNQKNTKRIQKVIFISSFSLSLLLVVYSNLFAQNRGGLTPFALKGSYEYPVIPDFFTMIYSVGVDFNFYYLRDVSIFNSILFQHRISSTDDYFPDNVYGVSYRLLLFNHRILILNAISSNSTKPFQSIHGISNQFVAGYNFLNFENLSLYVGLAVFKPIPFLGEDFNGIPLPFALVMYRNYYFSIRFPPLDLKWTPKKVEWLEIQLKGFLSDALLRIFFHVNDFIYMGPELEYKTESLQDASRQNKKESIRLMYLQVGARFYIYSVNIFVGYSFFNEYSIRTPGKSGGQNTVKPGGAFDFDLGFRFVF